MGNVDDFGIAESVEMNLQGIVVAAAVFVLVE